jgi:hypothetical protein
MISTPRWSLTSQTDLNSAFSTFAKFAANVDPRPPAPINASTTLLFGDCARPDCGENTAGTPASATNFRRLTDSIFPPSIQNVMRSEPCMARG